MFTLAKILTAVTSMISHPIATEKTMEQIVSIFEYSTPVIQYCAIEDIHDGRGFTAGNAGFTTATGDFYELILRYRKLKPDSPFNQYEEILKNRALHQDPSTVGIEKLPMIWKSVCETELFKKAQDQLVHDFYKKPAQFYLKNYNLHSPLAYLIFFDTVIQHGDGNDPDSFKGVIHKMNFLPSSEPEFLMEFLRARIMVLNYASNPETREVWKESVDRAFSLLKLVQDRKFKLRTPLTIHVWDENWNL